MQNLPLTSSANTQTGLSVTVQGVVLILLLMMTGCASYSPQYRTQTPPVNLPEVRRAPVRHHVTVPPVVHKPRVKSVARVKRYTDGPVEPVVTQKEVQSVLKHEDTARGHFVPQQAQSEIDPYANIPESKNESNNYRVRQESSPAIKSLMIRARADMAIGNDQSAVSKLERALRIEADNPDLWLLLAKAHQSLGEHQQAITMAKKAISFAGRDENIVSKSWILIKQSGEASGDTMAVKEAINYSNVNP